ncbi:M20/M25/M40 family metallo-hydrolase [Persicimonas caeni]|uniref:M20/M25/M40 family metallo-hydrolase n=1 Tax=Persicimonas caeni TaxID=2292766 RepID=A0A4Y6PT41_PERCE|nr:M20/M25/M40 family metallo-hydrolase [Persicimonas caeni]QDG51197.1 M20/M25/M40 family metallo-hydrolase [Persicimonas caeni]QED32418.1 M20/M25/M40 family metallo-hydrolase [Persicimonas caeni]
MPLDPHGIDWDETGREAVELFKGLLRLDTTNPPGNENRAAEYLAEALSEDGLDPWIVESAPGRANLVVRLPATVDTPTGGPLLLAGHTDVVPAQAARWTHPPFSGAEEDGHIWGRGAVDMKNMVAMSTMVAKLMARSGRERKRDLIVAAVADEEAGCGHGSKFLVDNHPSRVNAEFMLGEVGGFWLNIGPQSYIPIMVAEKGSVHLRMTARGPSGHGSIPRPDNALVQLASAIETLGKNRLPYHLSPVMEDFIRKLADTQPLPASMGLKSLLNSRLSGPVLDKILPDPSISRNFNALLHNTVSPTVMHAGSNRNVIPGEASCDLDGRTLPHFNGQDLKREVERCIDDPAIDIEVVSEAPAVQANPIGSPLLDTITDTLAVHAPDAIPAPYMIPGHTDARFFSRLGMRCYGFAPLKLDPDSDLVFSDLFHGVDERVPVDGFVWGQRVLYDVVSRFLAK